MNEFLYIRKIFLNVHPSVHPDPAVPALILVTPLASLTVYFVELGNSATNLHTVHTLY